MADNKKNAKTANQKPTPKGAKVMSSKDCKNTKGGMASFVDGGLAGPVDYRLP